MQTNPAMSEENYEALHWGLFLECYDAFTDDGSLPGVKPLTVQFVSAWLQNRKRFISEKAVNDCALYAENSTEHITDHETRKKERRKTFDRLVVTYVIKVFMLLRQKDPNKTEIFISGKRSEYQRYRQKISKGKF